MQSCQQLREHARRAEGPSIMNLGQFVCKKKTCEHRKGDQTFRGKGCLDRLGATQNGAPLISIISRFGCLTQLDRRYIMLPSKIGRGSLKTLVTGFEIVGKNIFLGKKKKKKRWSCL